MKRFDRLSWVFPWSHRDRVARRAPRGDPPDAPGSSSARPPLSSASRPEESPVVDALHRATCPSPGCVPQHAAELGSSRASAALGRRDRLVGEACCGDDKIRTPPPPASSPRRRSPGLSPTSVCTRGLARATAAESGFDGKVAAACDVPSSDLRSRRGLGFRDAGDAGHTRAAGLGGHHRGRAPVRAGPRAVPLTTRSSRRSRAPMSSSPPPGSRRAPPSRRARGRHERAGHPEHEPAVLPARDRQGVGQGRSDAGSEHSRLRRSAPQVRPPDDRLERSIPERDACRGGVAVARAAKTRRRLAKDEARVTPRCWRACGELHRRRRQRRGSGSVPLPRRSAVADIDTCLAADLGGARERAVGTLRPRDCPLLPRRHSSPATRTRRGPSCGNARDEAPEVCDDGNADDRTDRRTNLRVTGPADLETVLCASTALRPDSPDGTPVNAVPLGGTLATQFGGTTFELESRRPTPVTSCRGRAPERRVRPAPGFAGGAGSFKPSPRTDRPWRGRRAPDPSPRSGRRRRSNNLEDTAGADSPRTTSEPTPSPSTGSSAARSDCRSTQRLSRRAVFHAGADLAFMARTGRRRSSRATSMPSSKRARALPGAPASVPRRAFARHALHRPVCRDRSRCRPAGGRRASSSSPASSFSRAAAAPCRARHLPASDARPHHRQGRRRPLPRRAGHAAPRCVDGTPCTSTPIARWLRCRRARVATSASRPSRRTPARTRDRVAFINPIIQASGDTAGIQGDPRRRRSGAIHMDFGSGTAVATIPGPRHLGALPPSSARPVSASSSTTISRRVRRVPGLARRSRTGPTDAILGLVVPGAVVLRPVPRLDQHRRAQPPQAVPHNGVPTATLSKVWGQEKEITSLPRFLPALFAGGTTSVIGTSRARDSR